jgi:hypothetical protein
MFKKMELTGSPKSTGFKTKASFLNAMSDFGWTQDKMRIKNNQVKMLVTNDIFSNTNKMKMAKRLGIDIVTYDELVELFELL